MKISFISFTQLKPNVSLNNLHKSDTTHKVKHILCPAELIKWSFPMQHAEKLLNPPPQERATLELSNIAARLLTSIMNIRL